MKTVLCFEIIHSNLVSTASSILMSLQRLVLLSVAARACTTIRASDLPVSALEPVMQLRVMGDFSISSEDGDEEDTPTGSALRDVSQRLDCFEITCKLK